MANHLTLRYTHLEFDGKGNLSIFSDGKAAHLSSEEIVPLLIWLIRNKNQPTAKLQTHRNEFLLERGTLVINGVVRIFAKEVGQIYNWVKKWQREHREVFVGQA